MTPLVPSPALMNDWEITTNRYVAFIDIMGFQSLVARSTHAKIYEMMKKIKERTQSNENINWVDTDQKLVWTTTYSDSIMIYSKDSTKESLESIIATVAALTNDLLTHRIPHKGSIAFGEMTLDIVNSVFFGRPLIDAYLLHDELCFYGIVAHSSFEEELEKQIQSENAKHLKSFFIMNYLCPFKQGNANHLTIWPMYASAGKNASEKTTEKTKALRESVNSLRFETSGHLRKYIDNTLTYFDEVKKVF